MGAGVPPEETAEPGAEPSPTIAKGTTRRLVLPSCSLNLEDLERLFALLNDRSGEAADRHIASLQPTPGQTPEQFAQLKNYARSVLQLVVNIQASSGEWIAGTTPDVLLPTALPDSLARVDFNSAFLLKSRGVTPSHSLEVILDFSRVSILDFSYPSAEPTLNASVAVIVGTTSLGLTERMKNSGLSSGSARRTTTSCTHPISTRSFCSSLDCRCHSVGSTGSMNGWNRAEWHGPQRCLLRSMCT